MVWMLALLIGCGEPASVTLTGRIVAERDADAPMANGLVEVRDADGAVFDSTDTDGHGGFEVTVPYATNLFAVVGGGADVPASFAGVSGPEDFELEEGQVYAVPQAQFDAVLDLWSGCPQAGQGGAVIAEIRATDLQDPITGENPTVSDAFINVFGMDGEPAATSCYLNAEGEYDPERTSTAEFTDVAIFGLDEGLYDLEVGYTLPNGVRPVWIYRVYVPDGGVVPLYPAGVEITL